MSNLILNEGYQKTKVFFEEGYKDKIKHQGKLYIDLSNCAGSLILGHNSKIYKENFKKINISRRVFYKKLCRN